MHAPIQLGKQQALICHSNSGQFGSGQFVNCSAKSASIRVWPENIEFDITLIFRQLKVDSCQIHLTSKLEPDFLTILANHESESHCLLDSRFRAASDLGSVLVLWDWRGDFCRK